MKLVPVTFPLSRRPSIHSTPSRAQLRETGPIRITLRAIEAAPPAASAPRTLSLASAVTAKKKTSGASDVLMMLL